MPPENKIPKVVSVHISPGGIPKHKIPSVFISQQGLQGDGHNHEKHYRVEQAVSVQDIEKLNELNQEGYQLDPGTTGENIVVENLDINKLDLGTILSFPSGLRIRLTKVRKPCYVLDAINPQLKEDIVGRCGMYAEVLQEGELCAGDSITIISASN